MHSNKRKCNEIDSYEKRDDDMKMVRYEKPNNCREIVFLDLHQVAKDVVSQYCTRFNNSICGKTRPGVDKIHFESHIEEYLGRNPKKSVDDIVNFLLKANKMFEQVVSTLLQENKTHSKSVSVKLQKIASVFSTKCPKLFFNFKTSSGDSLDISFTTSIAQKAIDCNFFLGLDKRLIEEVLKWFN